VRAAWLNKALQEASFLLTPWPNSRAVGRTAPLLSNAGSKSTSSSKYVNATFTRSTCTKNVDVDLPERENCNATVLNHAPVAATSNGFVPQAPLAHHKANKCLLVCF
jgi:uncharacterized protein (DUF1684 family)